LSDARQLSQMRPQVDALKWTEVMRELNVLGVQLGTGRPESVRQALGRSTGWPEGNVPQEFSVCARSRRPKGSHVLYERFLDRPGVDLIVLSLRSIEQQSDCRSNDKLNGMASVGRLKLGSDLDLLEEVLGLPICQDDEKSIYLLGRTTPLPGQAGLKRREQIDIEVQHPRGSVVTVSMKYTSQDDQPPAGSRRSSESGPAPVPRSAPSGGGAR
jgi:hypothetical protein